MQDKRKTDDESGIRITIFGSSLRICRETIKDLLRFAGSDRVFVVRVLAIGILILMICYGASLIR